MNLLDLPNIVLIQIFEHLSYDEVSKKRLVCEKVDKICQHILNGGFNKVVRQHGVISKRIKALLPRRESERRNHCMARHADILTSIETRISMLSMTYTKYIDLDLCCFIPGRVLDEILRILSLISNTAKPLRPYEVLQELRDISSMAIEHFDEQIASTLKKSHIYNSTSSNNNNSTAGNSSGNSTTDTNKGKMMTSAFFTDYMDNKANMLFIKNVGSQNEATSLLPPNCNETLERAAANIFQIPVQASIVPDGSTNMERTDPWAASRKLQSLNPNDYPFTLFDVHGNCRLVQLPNAERCKHGVESREHHINNAITNVAMKQQQQAQQQHHHRCPEAKATMTYFKKLDLEYKKGILKMQRMQQIQTLQSRRLQQALSSVAELNIQVTELRKRLEDVDAKNREISVNIKQINTGGDPVAAVADSASSSATVEEAIIASSSSCLSSSAVSPASSLFPAPFEENSNIGPNKTVPADNSLKKNENEKGSTKRKYDKQCCEKNITATSKEVSANETLPTMTKKSKII